MYIFCYLLKSRSSIHCRDTWLEGRGFQRGNREVETLHDLMTFAASVVRAWYVLQSQYPTFWSWIHHLEPVDASRMVRVSMCLVLGLSDEMIGPEIPQTPSEIAEMKHSPSSCNGKQCLNITQNHK